MMIKHEKGQALILVLLAMVALVGMIALAIDGGNAFLARRSAQNAADSAAMAAAYQLASGGSVANAVKAARNLAAANGFSNDAHKTVVVNIPPKQSVRYQGNKEYVEVVISIRTMTYLGGIVGISETSNTVEAIARGRPYRAGQLFGGSAIVALKEKEVAFTINGNAKVKLQGGGFWSNSNNSQKATILNGHITFESDKPSYSVGKILKQGNISVTGMLNDQYGNQIALPPDLSMIPDLPKPPACNGAVGNLKKNMTPGRYFGGSIPNDATFQSGVYCFIGGVSLQSKINSPDASVIFVFENTAVGLMANATANVNLAGLEVYVGNGDVHVDGSASVAANRLRIFSNGTSRMIVNGNASMTSSNAFLYLQGGFIMWNGVAKVQLKAPPKGDPFASLLIFSPWSNQSSYHINGNSDTLLVGTILTPHANVTINGNAGFDALRSQVVGYEVTINGNAPVSVVYDPSENVADPEDAQVQLAK